MRRRAYCAESYHPFDKGASAVDYGAILLIIGVISAALILIVPNLVGNNVKAAVCGIFGGSNCQSTQGQDPNRTALPERCVSTSGKTEKSNNFKVILYRRNSKNISQIDQYSDGSIWETTGSQTGNGIDIKAGVGAKINDKGASINVGGEGIWNADKQARLQFKNTQQRDEYGKRVRVEVERALQQSWANLPKIDEIQTRISQEMGIPRVEFKAKGYQGGFGVDGSYAIVSGKYKFEGSELNGERHDDNGTADPKDDTATQVYQYQDKHNGDLTLGLSLGDIPGAKKVPVLNKGNLEGKVYGDYAKQNSFEIQHKNGKPVKLSIIRQRPWTVQTDYSAGGSHNKTPERGGVNKKAGPKGNLGNGPGSGGVSVERTDIDLEKDPGALDAYNRWLTAMNNPWNHPSGGQTSEPIRSTSEDLGRHIQQHGAETRTNYDRDVGKDGFDISGSYGIELGAYENKTDTEAWDLEDAQYRDPATGEWKPWVQCKK